MEHFNHKVYNFYTFLEDSFSNDSPVYILNHPKKTFSIPNSFQNFFRQHNILLFNDCGEVANIDTYYEGYAYTCLCKSNGLTENEIALEDVTLSVICYGYPLNLIHYLRMQNYNVISFSDGVYKIEKQGTFSTLIIMLDMLPVREYVWMKNFLPSLVAKKKSNFNIHTIAGFKFCLLPNIQSLNN